MCKKILMGMFVVMVLLFFLPGQGHSSILDWGKMSTIVTPENDQHLSTLPVKITIQFNEAANPSTFKAWLNGKNITSKFQQIEGGMAATVGPEDGLRIAADYSKVNALLTSVRGFRKELDMDAKVFFAKVEAMETIGPEGGVVEVTDPASPLYGVRVEIPSGALASSRAISIAERENPPPFENGSSGIGTAVEIGPSGTTFEQPVTLTFKYNVDELRQKKIVSPSSLDIYTFSSDGIWIPLENVSLDEVTQQVSAQINHLSTYWMNGDKLYRYPENASLYPSSSYTPVLFVHGLQVGQTPMGNAIQTFGLDDNSNALKFLHEEGVDVWAFEYNSWRRIEQTASNIVLAIDHIISDTAKSEINVISHSMGGLVTRAYVQNGATTPFRNDIKKLLMIGCPNHGSNFAEVGWATSHPSMIQMDPDSDTLQILNSAPMPQQKKLAVELVYGWHDFWLATMSIGDGVVSAESAKLCPEFCSGQLARYQEHRLDDYYHIVWDGMGDFNWDRGIAAVTSKDHAAYPIMSEFAKDMAETEPPHGELIIESIDPRWGAPGWQINIVGKNFGFEKGEVYLGGQPCNVTFWAMNPDTGESMARFIVPVMAAGLYDLTILVGWLPPIVFPDGFTVQSGEKMIGSIEPHNGVPGQVVAIFGVHFGPWEGKVYMDTQPCNVIDWTDTAVRFVVPSYLAPGNYDVTVTNEFTSDTLTNGFTVW